MDKQAMREYLTEVIYDSPAANNGEVKDVCSYEERGLLTRDEGLVVRFDDGSEFQVTIVQSGFAEEPEALLEEADMEELHTERVAAEAAHARERDSLVARGLAAPHEGQ